MLSNWDSAFIQVSTAIIIRRDRDKSVDRSRIEFAINESFALRLKLSDLAEHFVNFELKTYYFWFAQCPDYRL